MNEDSVPKKKVHVTIPESLFEEVDAILDAHGIKWSEFVIRACKKAIREDKIKNDLQKL